MTHHDFYRRRHREAPQAGPDGGSAIEAVGAGRQAEGGAEPAATPAALGALDICWQRGRRGEGAVADPHQFERAPIGPELWCTKRHWQRI